MSDKKPVVVTLCGSTRFSEAFHQANLRETLAGRIVLTIGCDFKSDDALGLTDADKARLDELHLRKIDLCDEILVLNVGGYVGQSTHREIEYAIQHAKRIRWLDPEHVPAEYARTAMDQRKDWQVVWVQAFLEMAGMAPEPEVLDDGLTEMEARRMATQRKMEFARAVGMRIFPRLRPGAIEERMASLRQQQQQQDRRGVQDGVDHRDTELLPPV